MKKKVVVITALCGVILALSLGLPGPALADCVDTGNTADGGNVIVCDTTSDSGDGNGDNADHGDRVGNGTTPPATINDDEITVQSGATISGESFRGISIDTGPGEDDVTIEAGAEVSGGLNTHDDADEIEISGSVGENKGHVSVDGGDDTVTLSGSEVEVEGTIDGGGDADTLNFNMSTTVQQDFTDANTAITAAQADQAGGGRGDGEFDWGTDKIKWVNFETLNNNLTLIQAAQLNVAVNAGDGGGQRR